MSAASARSSTSSCTTPSTTCSTTTRTWIRGAPHSAWCRARTTWRATSRSGRRSSSESWFQRSVGSGFSPTGAYGSRRRGGGNGTPVVVRLSACRGERGTVYRLLILAFGVICVTMPAQPQPRPPQNAPRIERLDPALDRLIASDAKIETLGEGYDWTEGPVWVKNGG